MTTRRRSRPRRGTSPRTKTTWDQAALGFQLGTAGVVVSANLTPAPLSFSEDFHGTATLMRLIMSVEATQETVVANVPQTFAMATYVGQLAAFIVPTVLAPLGNSQNDWHYWTHRSTFADNTDGSADRTTWEVDLRTKRRLRGGFGYFMVVEPAVANTALMDVIVGIRLLWAIQN